MPEDKLPLKDFAARIKQKYPTYKGMPDDELVNKIVEKYPEYKQRIIFPEPPAPPVNNTKEVLDIAKQLRETKNIISQSEQSTPVSVGGGSMIPMAASVGQSDRMNEKIKVKQLGNRLKELGYNAEEVEKEFADLPYVGWYNIDKALQEKKENPQSYERTKAAIRWQVPLADAIRAKGGENAELIVQDILSRQSAKSREEVRNNMRNDIAAVRQYVDDPQEQEKIIAQIIKDKSFGYGQIEETAQQSFEQDPRNERLNHYQLNALQFMEDTEPEKYKTFNEYMNVNPAASPSALRGWEFKARELERMGMGLEQKALEEQLTSLVNKKDKGELTEQDAQRYLKLYDQYETLQKDIQVQSKRYPNIAALDADMLAQEAIQQRNGSFKKFVLGVGEDVDDVANWIGDTVQSPFLSKSEKRFDDLEDLGDKKVARSSMRYTTAANQLLNPNYVHSFTKDLQAQIDKVKADESLSVDEKINKTRQIILDNPGKVSFVANDKAGKFNFTANAWANTVSDVASSIFSQAGLAFTTGGAGNVSKLKQARQLFTTVFATTYHDKYVEAMEKGIANPSTYATVHSAIEASTGLINNDLAVVKNLVNPKSTLGKIVGNISKEQWDAIAKSSRKFAVVKKALANTGRAMGSNTFREVFEEMTGQAASNIASDKFFNEETGLMEGMKETFVNTLLGTLPLSIIGLPAQFGKLNRSQKYAIYEAAQNSEKFLSQLEADVQSGAISKKKAEQIRAVIERAAEVYGKGKKKASENLTDNEKTDTFVKEVFQIEEEKDGDKKAETTEPVQEEKPKTVFELNPETNGTKATDNTGNETGVAKNDTGAVIEPDRPMQASDSGSGEAVGGQQSPIIEAIKANPSTPDWLLPSLEADPEGVINELRDQVKQSMQGGLENNTSAIEGVYGKEAVDMVRDEMRKETVQESGIVEDIATPESTPKPSGASPKPKAEQSDFDVFKESVLTDLENETSSAFDFTFDEIPLQQSHRKTAVKNIRAGKSTVATKRVLEAVQKMFDDGYVYLTRGRGAQTERIQIPLKEYLKEIKKPIEATELDFDMLNTELGEDAFNETFDNIYNEVINETERSGTTTETKAATTGAATESVTETTGSESKPPVDEEVQSTAGEAEGTGITHADTAELRKEFSLPDYEKKADTVEAWDAEADARIANGEMGDVLEKLKTTSDITAVETRMMGKYIATLAAKADASPTPENIKELKDAIALIEVAGSKDGKALRARQGIFLPDDSLSGNIVKRQEAAGVDALTEKQLKEVEDLVNELKKANQEAANKLAELERRNVELQAELEIANAKKETQSKKKDFKSERKDIKQSIKEKWNKAANDGTLTAVPVPYAKQLAAIAPDVAKLMKSYVEEGVVTLVEIIDKIHGDVQEVIPEVTKADVFDIVAGEYTEPRQTKNEILEKLRDLRDEATYLNKLDALNSGAEPKTERAKKERNRKIKELQDKIKEHDVTKLSQIKKRNEQRTKELEEKLRNGDFENKRKLSAIDNTELAKKYPDLYKATLNAIRAREEAKHKIDLANLNEQMARQTMRQKVVGHGARALRTAKALLAGIDDSAVFVQNMIAVLANPSIAKYALKEHALDALSAERFERNLAKLHSSAYWPLIEQSGLSVVDPKSLRESEKNDIFNDTYFDYLKIKTKGGKEISLAFTKPFERAFTSLGNNLRVNLFLRKVEELEAQGKTFENAPDEFKSAASVINNISGRGTMIKSVEKHNDILSAVLWSPRLLASSLNILGVSDVAMLFVKDGKGFYANLTPAQRKFVAEQVVKGIGMGIAIMAALAYSTGGEADLDPTSVTFGTVKVGDYRYTLFGRYNSVIRMLFMRMQGKKTINDKEIVLDAKAYGATTGNEMLKFLRGKANPIFGLGIDLATKKTFDGKPVTLEDEAERMLTPMSISEFKKGFEQDGLKGLAVRGIPSFTGIKVSNEKDFERRKPASNKKPTRPKRSGKPKKTNPT